MGYQNNRWDLNFVRTNIFMVKSGTKNVISWTPISTRGIPRAKLRPPTDIIGWNDVHWGHASTNIYACIKSKRVYKIAGRGKNRTHASYKQLKKDFQHAAGILLWLLVIAGVWPICVLFGNLWICSLLPHDKIGIKIPVWIHTVDFYRHCRQNAYRFLPTMGNLTLNIYKQHH